MTAVRLPALLLTVLLLPACEFPVDDKPPGETGGTGEGGEGGEGGETGDTGFELDLTGPGVITGTIYYDLYTYDADGLLQYLDWEDAYGGIFPFGRVFVSAYTWDEEGEQDWWSEDVIAAPVVTGDAYTLEFGFEEDTEVVAYAALDYWGDGTISSYDPYGEYDGTLIIEPGVTQEGIDIHIDVPYDDFSQTGGGGWTYILLEGDLDVKPRLADADCKALVYSTSDYGPYTYASFVGSDDSYAVYAPVELGEVKVYGACDSNLNALIDPADTWGGYSTDGDEPAVITIDDEDLLNYDITIPLGEADSPTNTWSGVVRPDDLTMDLVTEDSVLYVTVQVSRPEGSFDPDSPTRAWDWDQFASADIRDSNPYSLELPVNTVAYLWGCLDVDGNGTVNEAGEPCGVPTADGKIATGTNPKDEINFWIHTME